MKILAIRGCNLASIEGEFEIDFTTEPLRSAGLFAITGHTGSGKSTILDSLCLALYAKTPRSEQSVERVAVEEKNNIQQNDARAKAAVSFAFLAAAWARRATTSCPSP